MKNVAYIQPAAKPLLLDQDFIKEADLKLVLEETKTAPKEIVKVAFSRILEQHRTIKQDLQRALEEIGRLHIEDTRKTREIVMLMNQVSVKSSH